MKFFAIIRLALALFLAMAGQSFAAEYSLHEGTLSCGSSVVLEQVPPTFSLVKDSTGAGVFLRLSLPESPLGRIAGLRRFTSCHRDSPFWMSPATGSNHADIKLATQWLLAETGTNECVMLVTLIADPLCFNLSGDTNGLKLTGETADPAVRSAGGVAIFVSMGNDPYQMVETGARAVMAKLRTGKLRRDKPTPDFVNDFGWCTWDAFYKKVSPEKIRAGLESFKAGQIEPRFLILDDGWQDYRKIPTGEEQLVSLSPNQEQFSGDLRPTVRMAKDEFKIRTLLVWHAFLGYWGGVNGTALPDYDVRNQERSFGRGMLKIQPNCNTHWWGHTVGVVPPDRIGQFYEDYHRRLAAQGVDGVKVDSQSMIESVAHGLGGRVALTRAYRTALEKSAAKHFDGRLINCMANAMETYYASPRSTLMRTSDDFYPKKPASHGKHVYCNAQVGLWFGEFMQPDWDMFQSAHTMGSFHASARAVSGGPVYVSDAPDTHDFALLRKLVLSDGTVLRADNVGRPTRDCLFADVTREPVLLKVFNHNRDCAVLGIFNANYHYAEAERTTISGDVSPSDAPDLRGKQFVGFAHQSNRLWQCRRMDREPLKLAEGEWEVVSFAPVEHGMAVLGLADKLNSTGAIISKHWAKDGSCTIELRDGGKFLAWCATPPSSISCNAKRLEFIHDAASGRLEASVPPKGAGKLTLRWQMRLLDLYKEQMPTP
ncbi:MAG: Sip1-related alpha-galactosidase [Verrucomicrobia bacterium]|nr:Sip1-related alpha-galactosidase [Verrucomicrobiota bacterium]